MSQYIFTTTSFQEGPHQKLFFHKVKMKGGLDWIKKKGMTSLVF